MRRHLLDAVGAATLLCSIPLGISGCYTGVSADASLPAAGEDGGIAEGTSGGEDDGDSSGGEPQEPELGACDPGELGGSTLRRLNRREYSNTVQDLFGLPAAPEVSLPWDDLNVRGFDNDGSSLSLDLTAAEQYFEAADSIAATLDTATAQPLEECVALTGDALSTCIDDGLSGWLEHAFRQPVSPATVEALRGFTQGAQSYAEARDAIATFTLTSPLFLFHYKPPVDAASEPDAYLIANRLSYLLWSSGPDDALLDAAADGSLADLARIEAEVDRMLADPRSARFFDDFARMWLRTGVLDLKPDAATHLDLFEDMELETQAFFASIASENMPLSTLLDGSTSYINGRLADHYGIDVELGDDEWDWVEMPPERRGLLTLGAVLVTSSGDTFSDPIRRGAWVAEHIVCLEPPPPSGEIPDLPVPGADDDTTIRELLEQHRADPACAGCHALMDPYGFALETYDRLGLHRTHYDNGREVDASGVLPGGEVFDDAITMVGAMNDGPNFEQCTTEYLAAYSVGRALSEDEACFVELVLDAAHERDEDIGFRDLLVAISGSYMFVHGGNE